MMHVVQPCFHRLAIQRGVEILLVASCYRNQDNIWPDRPIGSYADFTFTLPVANNIKETDMAIKK